MDLDPRNILNLLHENLEDENEGPKACHQLLVNLNDVLIQEQLNLSYIDLCLQCMFNKSNGLPNFVSNILNKKSFKSSVITVLEVIYTLINNFPSKLEKYVFTIHEICMKVSKSSLTTSDEKVKSLEVLNLSFEKIDKCVENPDHYDEIYNSLRNSILIKKTNSVQEKVFIALGTYAKRFQLLVKNPDNLKNLFLNQLEVQMAQEDFSYKAVNGLFIGLDQFCESYPFDLNIKGDVEIVKKLYRYVDRLAVPAVAIKVANRAALTFLANNISLFVNLIIENHKHWHENLLKWLDYGSDDQKTGFLVVRAFYQGLGNFLFNDVGRKYQSASMYFLQYFEKVLKDNAVSNNEKRLCLHGLASFSAAFFLQLKEEEMKDLLVLIMHTFEETYVYNSDPSTEALEYLPDYVQTVAKFIHLKKNTNNELFCLQKGVILMIKSFPQMSYSYHGGVVDALVFTFHCLLSNDENVFNNFVENTVYQGVVWTCSHQHVSEAELLEGISENIITVKNYIALWKGLLRISPERKFDKWGIFLHDRRNILKKVIDKLVRTMLILINKLNVSIVLTETNAPVTDIQSAYKVAEVNDFAIFLNVVDFYEEVFSEIEPSILKKCICKLIHHLLLKCMKYPLISGFYKLLSFCLKTCNKLNYFEETNISSLQDVSICYQSLSKFIDVVLEKTKQFKGDLLIACLQVLLEYPTVIIRKMLPSCVPSFRTVFEVGRSYTKLAHMAIDTLEHWQKDIPNEEVEPFLVLVIPLLDPYLQSKSFGGLSQNNMTEARRKTAKALKKRKVLVEIEPELIKLQKRILHFVGQQSSFVCQAFVSSENNIDIAVWGDQHYLKVTLPYDDIKLDVYLDKLLPRIINLALNSTDRKTRVIACELLQAVMMVFLGTTKQMSHSALSDLNELLRHVAFPLLKLGCDLDQVVEQLFRPLFFQLIHWYTHPTQQRSEHSAIVIEAVMEGITHPTDTALRDFSGQCINEFIKWTIKQADENNLAHDPVNVKVLLKKMRFYSAHPDPFKRLGAALIFNNIYREVREEVAILSMFWIEFLHVFVKSLAMYENESDDGHSVVQINNALTHIERGFVEKSNLFNKSDRCRRVPVDMGGDVLKDIAVWLLAQTGSKSQYCREKCMELFCNITPYTKKYQNLQDFITNHVNKDAEWIKETYELFLIEHPTLDHLNSESSVELARWMQAFLCALDGYNFVLKKRLVPIESHVLSDIFITAIQYFIAKISIVSLDGALSLINPKQWIFTTFEKQDFDKQKSQVVRKVFQLFNSLLSESHLCEQMVKFYNTDSWNFVLNMIFNRHVLGFEPYMQYEDDSELIKLLEMFMKKLPADKTVEFTRILSEYVTSNFLIDIDIKSNVNLKHRNILKGLIMLQSFDLNLLDFERLNNGLIATLLNKFISNEENGLIYVEDLQNTTLNYCHSIFDFALNSESEFKVLLEFLYKPYQVQTFDYNQPVPFGFYILATFEDSLAEKIIANFQPFLILSIHQYSPLNHTIEIIRHLLNYMVNRKHMRKYYEDIVENVLKNWDVFEKYFNESFVNVEIGIDLLKRLFPIMKICKIKCENMKKWLIAVLVYDKNVSGKMEIDMKIEALRLLEGIMEAADEENVDLRANLLYLKTKFFLDTSPLPLEIKTTSLDKLLCTVPNGKSPELLTFLLDVYAKIPSKKSNFEVKNLLKDFILKNNEDIQEKTLIKIYELCHRDDFDNLQRYKLVTNVVSIFQYCQSSIFEGFFVANISEMFSMLKEPISHTNLMKKIVHFILLEVLFLRCPINSADTETSPIAQAALPKNATNKMFVLHTLKFALDAFKDSLEICSDFEELFRLYKCHAYNVMVSVVSNSMKDVNFYTKLFVRQEDNKDILWTSIIDTKRPYVFQTDFDTIPKRKKVLVNIRDEVRARRKLEDSQIKTAKYIESMRVYNSSLCEDLTKYDFTNNIVRSQSEDYTEDQEKTYLQSEIELDCTDVNNHECMANICGLIDHMVRTEIIALPDEEDENYILPVWLKGIRDLLLNEETHDNIKIFWVKVIDNTMHVFKHFAKWFLEPFLRFIVDKCAGASINYFITDVISILASWSTDIVPTTDTEVQLASQLLIFLIGQLNNDRQDMFKYQLELIKLLVEAWKTSLKIPHELIYSKLNVDATSRKVEVGIHLSSILLANNMAPWEENNIQEFCKPLFSIVMKSKYRSVYKPCSETIGLLLRFLDGHPYLTKISGNVQLLLKKIEEPDKYAHILEAMVLHYPQVADEFNLNKILSKIHAVPKDLKAIYLRIILKRSDVLDTIRDFKTEQWNTYIENDSIEIQLLSLEVVYKCLSILRESNQFKSFIEAVCKHVSNPNVLCRTRMYDIAILICQSESLDEDNKYKEIFDLCKSVLIQGMIDNDVEIRENCLNFWQSYANIPILISKRFSYILANLYKTNTEDDFLGYGSYLLLDTIKNKDEYKDMLFEHPLEDCDFEDYHLQTNWRVRHLSVVPLFAETLQSVSEDPEIFNRANVNRLRQTQTSLEFKPTQSVRLKQFSQYTMSESSLFIKSEDDSFVNPNQITMSYKYRVPKRRFLRDKSKIVKYFAQEEVKKSVKKTEHRKESAKERENKVTIYRSYRKGDLPDVQITLQAILEPLQVLTLHDSELSKMLYLEIYKNMLSKMGNNQDFMNEMSFSIRYIFNNSVQFNRNLFRVLLDVLLLSKNSIIIEPDLIASVSQSSGLTTLGVLLLEEYLISHDDNPVEAKRGRGHEVKSEINYWVKLAELYKEMDQWDVVKSIFLEQMDCRDSVKDALLAESRKQWRDAQALYRNLIEIDETLERKDFYYESYFKCFAHLGEWDNLVKSIEVVVSSSESSCWDNLWDQSWNQQKLMPWYINGQLKNALFNRSTPQQFYADLNKSLNSENAEYLQNHFSEELAMLWIFKGEADEAAQCLNTYINNFLSYWQLLDPLYTTLRYNKLMKLRNVVDINKFINVLQHLNVDSTTKIRDLISYWNRTADETLPSILLCEEKVLYRRQFVNFLTKRIELQEDSDMQELIPLLNQAKFKQDECLINTGIDQSNFYMTKKYLSTYNNSNILKLKLALSKVALIKSEMLKKASEKLALLLQASTTIAPILESDDAHLKVLASIQMFTNLQQTSLLLQEEEELFVDKRTKIVEIVGDNTISSPIDVVLCAAAKLKLFLNKYETELNDQMNVQYQYNDSKDCPTIASAYVKLAYFAKTQDTTYFKDFIFFVLRAMRYNSSEGRQLFPCILMEKEFSEENKALFMEETEKIPLWMFLGWIPQLLVNVDSPKVSAVTPMLLKIAKTYPQAIMYAYRLSKENYAFKNSTYINEAKTLITKLDELLLTDEGIDKFLKALSFVGVPAAILLYYIRKMYKNCQKDDSESFKAIQEKVTTEVFDSKPDSRDINAIQGNMFKRTDKYKNDIKNLTRLKVSEKMKSLKKIDGELLKILQDKNENKKNSRLLKDYCPWLANFSASKVNLDLEIPGQYDGKRLPLIQHHTKVSGFCPNVSVMSSLRKPVKVTVIGNDTKEYPFLVKFGEDVRQDQRIQQLFTLMNNVFENDKSLNERDISILTYQVIPLTTNLGIIQWIDNTTSLQDFVKKPLKDAKSLKSFDSALEQYQTWIYKSTAIQVDAYGLAAVKYSRDKTIAKFNSLVNTIKWDVLRSAFLELSANTEGFSALRDNFIKSYAVMCVSHWILGVGDRHLSNSLICSKNGKVLGIDFGHAFGTATQILPVPELVPFRLTPHIVSLMKPLGERGLFRETMIRCLRSLRLNTGSLLATMNVFIEEPSLDWLEYASRFGDADPSNCEWYPAQKVNQAKRKLSGANSTSIMSEDLTAGQQRNEQYLKAYLNLVKGLPENDVRARMESDDLSVEDQVDCLIDHATDYNLLGRMFEGWMAWV